MMVPDSISLYESEDSREYHYAGKYQDIWVERLSEYKAHNYLKRE